MLLREIFNTEPNHTWDENGKSARFKTDSGEDMQVDFRNVKNNDFGDYVDISFLNTKNKNRTPFKPTGQGEEFKTFGKIMNIVKDYTDNKKPSKVGFSGLGQGRNRLYQRLVDKYAKQLGYQLDRPPRGHMGTKQYYLNRTGD
jgi:hypothetical protein